MQNNPTYESNSTADVGSGADAFEMFEKGASIEEINAKFFPSESELGSDTTDKVISAGSDSLDADVNEPSDVNQQSDGVIENPQIDSSAMTQNDTGEDADGGADGDAVGEDSDGEKIFSQAEADSIAARVRRHEKGARERLQKEHDSVMNELADFFGVGTDSALDALRNAKYRREAEEKGIDDADMYARAQKAERELAQLKEAGEAERQKQFVDGFLADVEVQLGSYVEANPSVDIASVTADENFNRLLKDLYINPMTKDRCVEIAFGAFGAPSAGRGNNQNAVSREEQAPPIRNGEPRDGVNAQKKAVAIDVNRKRAAESAQSAKSGVQSQTLDYDKMSLEDFKKLGERAARGEIIVPSV